MKPTATLLVEFAHPCYSYARTCIYLSIHLSITWHLICVTTMEQPQYHSIPTWQHNLPPHNVTLPHVLFVFLSHSWFAMTCHFQWLQVLKHIIMYSSWPCLSCPFPYTLPSYFLITSFISPGDCRCPSTFACFSFKVWATLICSDLKCILIFVGRKGMGGLTIRILGIEKLQARRR